MHKKHNKYTHKDRHQSSSTTKSVKHKKEKEENAFETIKVPQNSVSELNKISGVGYGVKEKSRSKDKHKHRKTEELKSNDHKKSKSEKKSLQNIAAIKGLMLETRSSKHREHKEKRDKERLNKIEKYLEGLNKSKSTPRNKSLSRNSEILINQSKQIRKENTFHGKLERNKSPENNQQIPLILNEKKSSKKHKHKQSRERESSKDKNTRENQKSMLYCHVDVKSPFQPEKEKYNVEHLYPKNKESDTRKRSSSRHNADTPSLELPTKSSRNQTVHLREKNMEHIKFSPRKSKMKTDLKRHKDQRSTSSLKIYHKYSLDKKSQKDKETNRQGRKKHREVDSSTKMMRREKINELTEDQTLSEKHKKTNNNSENKEKIEDDIKGYFFKIQTLIDRKLDYILGNNNSKESKNTESTENEININKNKKELAEEKRHRSRSRRQKKERQKTAEENKKKKRSEEEMRNKQRKTDKKVKNSKHEKDTYSNMSLKRERYPSADVNRRIRRSSSHRSKQREDHSPVDRLLEIDKTMNRHKQHRSPYHDFNEYKMKPDHLISMLEYPSTFSIESNTSLNRKRMSDEDQPDHDQRRKRDKSLPKNNLSKDNFGIDELEKAYLQKIHNKKSKKYLKENPSVHSILSSLSLLNEKTIDATTRKPDNSLPRSKHQKRDKSLNRNSIPTEDFNVDELKPPDEIIRMKKRLKQPMNLECKTVSIVGIPSQIRESTIFNETQTTTSLNVINPVEDFMEKKKRSKRFKLYYKYSVADNKCSADSDKSSEGKKSIISDSYKMLSDPSDNVDVWCENSEESKNINQESDADSEKIIFVMKNEKIQKNCGDVPKKQRRRSSSAKGVKLNNILEEPSNISIAIHRKETPPFLNSDIDCTYYKSLKSSSSDCYTQLFKKTGQMNSHKNKNREQQKYLKENTVKHRSPSRNEYEKNYKQELTQEKPQKNEEKKLGRIESFHKTKNKRDRDKYKYASKSDINISYDSLRRYKCNKEKQKNIDHNLLEQLKHLLPECSRHSERINIDTLLREQLLKLITDLSNNMILAVPKQLDKPKPENHCTDSNEPTHTEPYDNSVQVQEAELKRYSSKNIGTRQTVSRIPSLISGSLSIQVTKGEITETPTITEHHDVSECVRKEPSEKKLVDIATEMYITEDKMTMSENRQIETQNQTLQTTETAEAAVEVEMLDPIKRPNKLVKTTHVKRCRIIDPYEETKITCMSKPTRPIINLENNQFPNDKTQQFKRQVSSLSEGKTRFEHREHIEATSKASAKRPVSAQDKYSSRSKTAVNNKRKKPTLTMSTNIVTIDTSLRSEESTENSIGCEGYIASDPNENYRCYSEGVDARCHSSSKSASSLNEADSESRIGSLVCVGNNQKLNWSSNSNPRSLDQYTTKSIVSDIPASSRLFLTKNFSPEMNTFQRRKMYDEGIRRKMKKRIEGQNQSGARVYEVRYLTLDNNFNESSEGTGVVNQKVVNKLPTFSTKINKTKPRSKSCKASINRSKKCLAKNKEDACKFSGRDIFAPLLLDVDQLNKSKRKAIPAKCIEEIFVKDEISKQENKKHVVEHKSTLVIKKEQGKDVTGEQVHSLVFDKNKVDFESSDQNFKELIDTLYNSIVTYCNSKFKFIQEETEKELELPNRPNFKTLPTKTKFTEKVNDTNDKSLAVSTLRDHSTSGCNKNSETTPSVLVSGHLSCPVLAGSTPSFDYLYEDDSTELNKEAVLSHFRKPIQTILGYAFNTTLPLSDLPKKEDQISRCTDSYESGYSSNNSKKCASVCSFFKRPSIVNLFKPVKKIEADILYSSTSIAESRSGPTLQEYNKMNQKCIEYAEKVRFQSEKVKNNTKDNFQEVPLDVLLLCRRSSTFLDDFTSNCSLCNNYSEHNFSDIIGDELSKCRNAKAYKNKNLSQTETMVFFENSSRKPSLEILALKNSQMNLSDDETSQLIKHMVQCPLVLSITNLNSCSLTLVEESGLDYDPYFGNYQGLKVSNVASDGKSYCSIREDGRKIEKSSTELDSINNLNTNSAASAGKYMAKKFFDNLLKVYQKEIAVTDRLFQDDDFFFNVLLESVKSRKASKTKTKNTKLRKLIKGKIKNYIGNVFFPKHCVDSACADSEVSNSAKNQQQRQLQLLASNARKYFSMYVQAVKTNKGINDEMKICGLLKLLERIEDGDFAILRKKEEVDFEKEIKEQVKEAFINIYRISRKEARKYKRSLTTDDLKLIRTFVSKYRIGLLSKTDLIATYIGRGVFKTEGHLKAAVTYLVQQSKHKDIDLRDFDEHCKILAKCSV